MTENLCINCNIRKIFIKKRQLCSFCYQKLYRRNKIPKAAGNSSPTIRTWQHYAEMQFALNYPNPLNLIYQPCLFRFNGLSYQPDFYDTKEDIFYEIVGTRQAIHQNQDKINQFKSNYPLIKLEIIKTYQRT